MRVDIYFLLSLFTNKRKCLVGKFQEQLHFSMLNNGNSIMLGKTAASTDRQKDFVYKFLTYVSAGPYL